MAENISDEQFKSEVMRFIEIANQKFDGLSSDVRTNSFKLDHMESRLGNVESKLDNMDGRLDRLENEVRNLTSNVNQLSSQFADVGVMAIKDNSRISDLEKRVDHMEADVH